MRSTARSMAGRRQDWLRRPPVRPTWRGALGPLVVAATVAVSWLPFASMTAAGDDPLGLYLGAVSIILMAWSFVLSVRLSAIEWLFGGLDRGYTWHRWIGTLSIVAMWLHIQQRNQVRGIAGADPVLAETGNSLAGLAETVFYVLIAMSIIRWVPYRWWRLTHKLLGIPYLFACFHFITAEKPYANVSAWGLWFAVIMLAGTVGWVWRVVLRDVVKPGVRYVVSSLDRSNGTTSLSLRPAGRRGIRHRMGQFAFVKPQVAGLSEPHPFSIASPPGAEGLRFVIRSRGDWTTDALPALSTGDTVLVEGPYGRLRLFPRGDRPTVWFAGGLGITPFLSGLAAARESGATIPHLFYSVRSREDAMGLSELVAAEAAGYLRLHLQASAVEGRLTREIVERTLGRDGLRDAHVVICGPDAFAGLAHGWASSLGARKVERESFDIRAGLGPDLSLPLNRLARRWDWVRRLQDSRVWVRRGAPLSTRR